MILQVGFMKVHRDKWDALEEVNKRWDAFEDRLGFPPEKRYRCMFGGTNGRVWQRWRLPTIELWQIQSGRNWGPALQRSLGPASGRFTWKCREDHTEDIGHRFRVVCCVEDVP